MARVYVSSTSEDLQKERKETARAISDAYHRPVGSYVASDRPPIEKCLADVESCRGGGYVGIVAFRYGTTPPGEETSYTELEYEKATACGLKRLVFLLKDDATSYKPRWVDSNREKIDRFRQRLEREKTVAYFSTSEELYDRVAEALRAELPVEREVPRDLRNLCNRSEHDESLRKAIGEWERDRPLVVVVHGDEDQGHQHYFDRLVDYTLPSLLARDGSPVPIQDYPFNWPKRCRARELPDRLKSELVRLTPATGFAAQQAAGSEALIHVHLLTEDWEPKGIDPLQALLEFWSGASAGARRVIVLISVKYMLKRGLNWWRRRAADRRNEPIRLRIAGLADPAKHDGNRGLPVVVLPMLDGVRRSEVEDWARLPDVSRFVGRGVVAKLIEEIGRTYETWERDHESAQMSMNDLARELETILAGFNRLRQEMT